LILQNVKTYLTTTPKLISNCFEILSYVAKLKNVAAQLLGTGKK